MTTWHKGTVEWFDSTAGEGVVRDVKDGSSYYVHYSTIQPRGDRRTIKNGHEKRNLKPGNDVRFQIFATPYAKQVGKIEEI